MKKHKVVTNDDLIAMLPLEEQEKIHAESAKIIAKWGGSRKNSGRKKITSNVLKFTKRVTEKEAQFIDYARKHHINYDDLMQG